MIKKLSYIIFGFLLFASCQDSKQLIFDEEFDGNSLNKSHWNYELGDGCPNLCGWGNNERQVYTKDNVSVRDGNLVITATKDSDLYYSGRITTAKKVEFKYGTIEVRAKLPLGQGLWPAIWMLGNDIGTVGWPACGEIDMMEYVGKNPHTIHATLHTPDSHGNSKNTKVTTISDIENGFHIYKCRWIKDSISFFIDDNSVYAFNPEIKNETTWPFDKPFYVILNLAIGGNFGGPEVDDSIFPQEFLIDYVKIYKN
ncbi:MAG TPA: glycoside hydrolase family 16 protein [Flavobacteriaceae bacterium]|nr:glycoside hydrolase family 16 protein [Flavobacteriaceae bacterium]